MTIKKIFKSSHPSINFVTVKGKTLSFVEGKYITDVEAEIQELEFQIQQGHPHLFIDPAEKEIDTTLQEALRAAQLTATEEVLKAYGAGKLDEYVAARKGAAVKQAEALDAKNGVNTVLDPAVVTTQNGGSMSAASLLNVASSANLADLGRPSNSR